MLRHGLPDRTRCETLEKRSYPDSQLAPANLATWRLLCYAPAAIGSRRSARETFVSGVRVRLAQPSDREQLARLRAELWPESSAEEHARELVAVFAGTFWGTLPLVVFVAESADGALAGFLEVGLRSHADHCDPAHAVGYVEGWYIQEKFRRQGIGGALLRAAEGWARGRGCTEMASDTQLDNDISQRVHQSLGFEAVERSVLFRKLL
jgi:aminoglycoside 6'-N-acetyltransferase I